MRSHSTRNGNGWREKGKTEKLNLFQKDEDDEPRSNPHPRYPFIYADHCHSSTHKGSFSPFLESDHSFSIWPLFVSIKKHANKRKHISHSFSLVPSLTVVRRRRRPDIHMCVESLQQHRRFDTPVNTPNTHFCAKQEAVETMRPFRTEL